MGRIVINKSPYCVFKSMFVKEDCWHGCSCGNCRFKEVKIDEEVLRVPEEQRNGYKDGKWKYLPNYRFNGQLILTSEYKFD